VPESLRFDGIYIDEGQDFRRNWFELCTRFLRAENSRFSSLPTMRRTSTSESRIGLMTCESWLSRTVGN